MLTLEKVQNLPERTKKVILWVLLLIIGVVLMYQLVSNFSRQLKDLDLSSKPFLPLNQTQDLKKKFQELQDLRLEFEKLKSIIPKPQ